MIHHVVLKDCLNRWDSDAINEAPDRRVCPLRIWVAVGDQAFAAKYPEAGEHDFSDPLFCERARFCADAGLRVWERERKANSGGGCGVQSSVDSSALLPCDVKGRNGFCWLGCSRGR